MATGSKIEWCVDTYGLWWGCVPHSPACDACYAEALAAFRLPAGWTIMGEGLAVPRRTERGDKSRPVIWGAKAPRIFPPMDGAYVREPLKWNRRAEKRGQREQVFVQSMGDICERHPIAEVRAEQNRRRAYLFDEVITACTWLDFLLLSKRPQDFMRIVPAWWASNWPANVWVGATVEDQQRARQRLPHLVKIPAPVRFISAEPLLGRIDLSPWIANLDWVIVGGESGSQARPSQIDWVRSVRDQVVAAGKGFHFKQWGRHAQPDGRGDQLVRLRTKSSRLIDGREWNELPSTRTT